MDDASFKVCPFCKEKIRKEAVKCRFCSEWLEQSERAASTPTPIAARPSKLPEPIEAPALPKTENEPAVRAKRRKEISVKALYWISGVLLAICVLVWFTCLVQVPWQRLSSREQVELGEKMGGGLLKMFVAVGLITWSVKRKGYKLLTFSIACAVCTAFFTYYFLDSRQKAWQKGLATKRQRVVNISSLQKFVQQGAVGEIPEFKPTGDADSDALFQAMRDFYAKYFQGWRQMSARLQALDERATSDDVLLTNKSCLNSEIQKRIDGQRIIAEFTTNALPSIANFKSQCAALQVGEEYKQGVLKGLDGMSPQFEAMFAAWLKSQKTEQLLLQFLNDNFGDYELKNGTILFETTANRQKYDVLAKDVQNASADVEDFRKRGMASMEASKRELQ